MYNAGIPVVATDTGDVREMLCTHNGQAGMLVELDENGKVPVNNSAKAVAEMVLNHEYYEQSRLNAIDRAQDFSIEAVVNNYLEYYFSE